MRWRGRLVQDRDAREIGKRFFEQLQTLDIGLGHHQREPSYVPPGTREARDVPGSERIRMAHEYNGNGRSRLLGCSRVNRTGCHDDIDLKPHEIFRELAHSPGVSLGPTKLDDEIGPLDVAQPPQLLAERFERIGECGRILPQETAL
jgi:hypothetical protein